MRMYARRFADIWPIFPARLLRSPMIPPSRQVTRADVITEYATRSSPLVSFLPVGWNIGKNQYSPLPDWQHILPAWKTAVDNLLDPDGFHETEI